MIATAHATELPLIPQPKSVIVPLDGRTRRIWRMLLDDSV
jgi:hypothetical protein